MACIMNDIERISERYMLGLYQQCRNEALQEAAQMGKSGPAAEQHVLEKCGHLLTEYHQMRYIFRFASPPICDLIEVVPGLDLFTPDPQGSDRPPNWPWPWPPPDWSSQVITDLVDRVRGVEDVVHFLTDVVSQPVVTQAGIGSLLGDVEVRIEAAANVHKMLNNATVGIAAEIEQLKELQ